MKGLLAFVFLLSMVGAAPAIAGHGGPDNPAAPSFVVADDGAPPAPYSPPSAEQPSGDDEAAPASACLLVADDGTPARRPDAPTMPAGTDQSVPRPPPTR